MTRKLTDEQVKDIKDNFPDNDWVFLNVVGDLIIRLMRCTEKASPKTVAVYLKCVGTGEFIKKEYFKTPDEAIAYAEHLLKQRYCWLPQQQSWIMSGEVIKFKDAGRLIELMHLAWDNDFSFYQRWFDCVKPENQPYSDYKEQHPSWWDFDEGLTIPADSPIWDAVKGVE